MNSNNNVATIELGGPIFGPGEAKLLLAELASTMAAEGRAIILNLAAVQRMDSLGISAIATAVDRCRGRARVVLAEPVPYVVRLLHLTQLHEVVEVFGTHRAAVVALST